MAGRSSPERVPEFVAADLQLCLLGNLSTLYLYDGDFRCAMVDGKAQLVPEVVDRMVAGDSVHQVGPYLAQPQRLTAIAFYHDPIDDTVPVERVRDFDKLLTDQGIQHDYVEAHIRHCESYLRGYVPVVKFMSDHLVGETP